jgi:hypothetical protein
VGSLPAARRTARASPASNDMDSRVTCIPEYYCRPTCRQEG